MQRMVVDLTEYYEVVEYAPDWAVIKWNLADPETRMLLVWEPRPWPWRKSHGRWVSKIMAKQHD